jgi:hypothetical protein
MEEANRVDVAGRFADTGGHHRGGPRRLRRSAYAARTPDVRAGSIPPKGPGREDSQFLAGDNCNLLASLGNFYVEALQAPVLQLGSVWV